jgi:hypothetical protein
MSEPVTLSGDQLVLLMKRAEIAGYRKALQALSEFDNVESAVAYLEEKQSIILNNERG